MDNDVVFALILVALVFIIARSLYGRHRRRIVDSHPTKDQHTPQAERRPSEVDHDHTDQPPMQHGTR